MTETQFSWHRLWSPVGRHLLLDEEGFLPEPDSSFRRALNPDIRTLSELDQPCLILLGEPGMGKTTELQQSLEKLRAALEGSKDDILFRDLNEYSSDALFVQDVFKSGQFTSWASGSWTLHLYLDSLDECQLRVRTVARLLARRLQEAPTERLRLRLVCRSADWPKFLTAELEKAFSREVTICELLPLTRREVRTAAAESGFDADSFMQSVRDSRGAALAQRPLTLKFMLHSFRSEQRLPQCRSELFEVGCRKLCGEWNPRRLGTGLSGDLELDRRLVVAGRLAAVSILCNRPRFQIHGSDGQPEGAVTVAELAGGIEMDGIDSFEVTEAMIRETLATSLFTAAGGETLAWGHKAYGEFLAARHLLSSKLDLSVLMNILTNPKTHSVIPPLAEVAALVAEDRPDFLNQVLDTDPQVLLRCDLPQDAVDLREKLTQRLLDLHDQQHLLDDEVRLWDRYKVVNHPRLAQQLQPYLCDATRNPVVQRVAFRIAVACKVWGLKDAFLEIALNARNNATRRAHAVHAIAALEDPQSLRVLKPLALVRPEEDPEDDIKGAVLSALWPQALSSEELFDSITEPQNDSYIGEYYMFLRAALAKRLPDEDLGTALKWVAKHARKVPRFRLLSIRVTGFFGGPGSASIIPRCWTDSSMF